MANPVWHRDSTNNNDNGVRRISAYLEGRHNRGTGRPTEARGSSKTNRSLSSYILRDSFIVEADRVQWIQAQA